MIQSKRKKIFKFVSDKSKRQVQFEFLKVTSITIIASITILVIGINYIVFVVLSTAQLGRYAQIRLDSVYFWINCFSLGIAAIAFVIGNLVAVHFSHRIVGPLYRIETILKNITDTGKPQEIIIRQDDCLQDLVGILNEMIQKRIK